MSIQRQLWLAIVVFAVFAFGVNFTVNLQTTRLYLEQQLAAYSQDSASALALSISQQNKDPVTVELLVAAQFDNGQYRLIRLADPMGQTLVERSARLAPNVPDWFARLVPLQAAEGHASINHGWKRFGELTVIVNAQAAYAALWKSILQSFWALAGMALVAALLLLWLLRQLGEPLRAVVAQAEAISERRFVTIPDPKPQELRVVVRAMNRMVVKLEALFAEEAARLDAMHRMVNSDPLTGLLNREHFLSRVTALLDGEEASAGALIQLRIADLTHINQRYGREETDRLLQAVADALQQSASRHPNWLLARLGGADFALFLPAVGQEQARDCADSLLGRVGLLNEKLHGYGRQLAHAGIALALPDEAANAPLARAEQAVLSAVAAAADHSHFADFDASRRSLDEWGRLLAEGLRQRAFFLAQFQAVDRRRRPVQREQLLRLRQDNGAALAAGAFLPAAYQLDQTAALDLETLRLALTALRHDALATPYAITLSAQAVLSPQFAEVLASALAQLNYQPGRLDIEVSESGVADNPTQLAAFASRAQQLGCRVGIKHFGRRLTSLPRLYGLGIHYIKVDSGLLRDVTRQPGSQAFLESLTALAHKLDIAVIGEGITEAATADCLWTLGFDAISGPYASQLAGQVG